MTLLSFCAIMLLPRQFHVSVVENSSDAEVGRARWLFPLYLVLIALPILPLARAGDALLAGSGIPSDLYVLALPLSQGSTALALFAFLGGLSAATGMVVVSTLTLSLMIGNHWLVPGLLRGAWSGRAAGTDLRGSVLLLRRAGILAIMLLAWLYGRLIAGNAVLADVGALSFSALATLAPPSPRRRLVNIVGGSAGNLVEWFDWYIYAAFTLYFAPSFFPKGDQTAQLLSSAAVFAVGFVMRPIGAWLFGMYADRRGRKAISQAVTVPSICAVSPSRTSGRRPRRRRRRPRPG